MQKRKLEVAVLSIFILFTSNLAQADFRKALDAYKVKNGNLVFAEVKNAVESKEYDGLSIFINSLQLDNVISKSRLFRGDKEHGDEVSFPKSQLELMMECELIPKVMDAIEIAVNQSQSLEAKYEYLKLRHGSIFPVLKMSEKSAACMPESDRKQLVRGMVELANQGYIKAGIFLFLIKENLGQKEAIQTSQNWGEFVKRHGYSFSKKLNLYLPGETKFKHGKPVLSIEKHSDTSIATYADTNYVIDIYNDGSVNFVRGVIPDNPRAMNRIVKKISPCELKQLISSIKKLGFSEQPKFQSNILLKDNMGISPHYGGFAIYRTYIVTLREGGLIQRLVFKYAQLDQDNGQAFLKSFLKLIDKTLRMQFYRCGISSQRQYFNQCLYKDL